MYASVEVEWRLKEMHATNSSKNIIDESLQNYPRISHGHV